MRPNYLSYGCAVNGNLEIAHFLDPHRLDYDVTGFRPLVEHVVPQSSSG